MAKILIAEDERDIRDLIEFTLKYAGHDVIKTSNGAEAVEKVPDVMPDLILMDVRMPRLTGYEACRQLKAMDKISSIPIVFLSAKGQQNEMDVGMEAGADDYILKPFAPDELTRRIAEILKKFGIGDEESTRDEEGTRDEESVASKASVADETSVAGQESVADEEKET
jgi:DNA-binding response OmpR family regulator